MSNILHKMIGEFSKSNGFMKLVYINITFFIMYTIIFVPQTISGHIPIAIFTDNHLAFSSQNKIILENPWTILSYMFVPELILTQ